MSVDPRHYHFHQRRRHLKDFERRAKVLLTEPDRKYLYGVLKDYQTHRQVELLITSLQVALDTPSKLDLLMDVRHFLPVSHLLRFDRLAPYHKMAHPVDMSAQVDMGDGVSEAGVYGSLNRVYVPRPAKRADRTSSMNGTMSLGRRPRSMVSLPTTSAASSPRSHIGGKTIVTGSAELDEHGPVKTVFLVREPEENLGFSVRGGSEHGLGIYVSEITEESPADRAGLCPGDHILEVNSIRFENIASSSAVKVLTGTTRLRITVKRVGKIPGFKFAREKTSWYDLNEGHLVEGSLEDHGTFHYPAGLAFVDGVIERRIHFSITRDDQYFGFNIRGGNEYGLGVYVSKVDPGGLAEQKGLKVGDQITAVNGYSLENMSHGAAVELLRTHKTLVLTVRDVGKYPAFKEIYAEYSWMDISTGTVTRSRSGLITSVPVTSSADRPNGHQSNFYSREALHDVIDGFSDVTTDNNLYDYTRSRNTHDAMSTSLYDDITDNVRSEEEEEEEEQVREMSFPEDACLTVPRASGSSTTSEDADHDVSTRSDDVSTTPDDVIRQLDTMLLPHTDDIILQERPLEGTPEDSPAKVKDKGKVRRDKVNPRSQLGVFALQLENMPEEMKKLSKSHRDRIQSLRKPGEINPRQFEDIQLNVKKTRTFREMLFGTKSRAKAKGEVSIVHKKKTRQPLTNLGFTDNNSDNRNSAASLDLNLEGGAGQQTTFVRGLGSQMMLQDAVSQPSTTRLVSDRARQLLTEDEVLAVTRHITRYEGQGDIEALVTPLLAILDSREKMTLLSEIRGIIRPNDVGRFDSMVSKSEFDAYEELAVETGTTSLMEQREQEILPPKKTLMASVPDSHGNFKLKKHEEYKAMQDKLNQVEKEHRERIAKLAHDKRQSLTDVERPFPNLPFAEHKQNEVSSPRAHQTLEILRPKSNSKVYKAIKVAVASDKNGQERKEGNVVIEVNGETEVQRSNKKEVEANRFKENNLDNSYLGSDLHTSSPLSSRRSSVSSSGVNGMYSIQDRARSNKMSASHPDLYSVSSIEACSSDLNDSTASGKQRSVAEVRHYRSAEESQSENVVVLISKSNLKEEGSREKPNDSLRAALDMLDGLDEGEDGEDSSSAQASPRSVTSVSTITSTRYGSYDVHPELESSSMDPDGDLSPRNPPVFVPPPPPSEPPPPPPPEEEDGWSEWVTDDVTDEVLNASSVGLTSNSHVATNVMRDKSVGQTPRDSPRESTVSVRNSISSEGSKEANLSNSNSNAVNDFTLDYFSGSQNDTSGNNRNNDTYTLSSMNVSSSSTHVGSSENASLSLHKSSSKQKQANKTNGEPPPQVNSLRDTLRARRKSADRPRLNADAFVFPEHLLVPEWGRITTQADNQQEEVVLDQQTVEYCDPPREPAQSPTRTKEEPIYTLPDRSHKRTSPELHRNPSGPNSLNGFNELVESSPRGISPSYNGEAHPVSTSEVETFMSRSETRGDLYIQQQQALESVIYAKPAELEVEAVVEEPKLIILNKTSSSLGISISGGRNSRTQPQVKIEKVIPGGAAEKEGTLKAGMRLVSIDGQSLANVTHRQAVEIIRRSYHNKKQPEMEILALP